MALALGACTFSQDQPIANLQFPRIERVLHPLYDLYFSADMDISGPYKAPIGDELKCALDEDEHFNLDHRMMRFVSGSVERDKTQPGLGFVSRILFNESIADGSSERDLTAEELRGLLSKRATIPCRFILSATFMNTYFSNVMYVPADRLLSVIGD